MKTQFLNFSSTYLHGKLKTEHSRVFFKLLFQNFRYFGKGWAKVFWLIEDPTQAWAPPRGGLWGYKPTRAVFKTICYLTNCPRCTKANRFVGQNKYKAEKGKFCYKQRQFFRYILGICESGSECIIVSAVCDKIASPLLYPNIAQEMATYSYMIHFLGYNKLWIFNRFSAISQHCTRDGKWSTYNIPI